MSKFCSQRGSIPIFAVVLIISILVSLSYLVTRIESPLLYFSKADSGQVPSADACNVSNDWEHKIAQSKFKNPDFQGGYSDGVPNNWSKFVISGSPQFGEETSYVPYGKSFKVSGNGQFSGGIYQTVDGLEVGKWYHAFYATAQKIAGETAGANPTLRQIGVDPNGGTNPQAVQNWGVRSAGGEPDKTAKKVGGWKVMGERNNPLVTFQATSTKATIFIKVTAESANSGTSDTWIISAFFSQDCGSGQTVTGSANSATGTSTNGNATSAQPYTATAASCQPTQVKMSFDPASPKVGDKVILNLSSTAGAGTTGIGDSYTGLSNCQDNLGLGDKFDDPNYWPKVPKYQTCTVTQTPIIWKHNWKNCLPNDQSCNSGYNSCSKTLNSSIGETTSSNISDYGAALKQEYKVTMTGQSDANLKIYYEHLKQLESTSKFPQLIAGTEIGPYALLPGEAPGNQGPRFIECKKIQLTPISDKLQFLVTLDHELGHMIDLCLNSNQSQKAEHTQVWNQEGGLTPYASLNNRPAACGPVNSAAANPGPFGQTTPGVDARAEDYAEMITFHLNPGAKDIYRQGCSNGSDPYANNGYPLHKQLAKKILDK